MLKWPHINSPLQLFAAAPGGLCIRSVIFGMPFLLQMLLIVQLVKITQWAAAGSVWDGKASSFLACASDPNERSCCLKDNPVGQCGYDARRPVVSHLDSVRLPQENFSPPIELILELMSSF